MLSFVILSLAAILHGLTGMGFPLIATPTLAMHFSPSVSIALLAIPTLIINAFVVFAPNQSPKAPTAVSFSYLWQRYWVLAFTSMVGSVIGVGLLFILPVAYLNLVMAVVILYYACQGLLAMYGMARPINVPTGNISMAVFGFLSGLIGGATNAMSPILLMYLLSKSNDKNEIATISNLCYLLAKIIQIMLLWQTLASFDTALWQLTGAISLLCVIGLMVGVRLRHRIHQDFFKRLIYGLLLIIGLKVGWTGLSLLIQ